MPPVSDEHAFYMSTASLSEDDFQQIQQIFMEKHYREFDDSDENKLSYTPIFNEYVSVGRFHRDVQFLQIR